MKTRLKNLAVTLFIFILITCNVMAAEPIQVIVHSKSIELSSPIRVENGRMLISLSDLLKVFEITPVWDKKTKSITAEKDGVKIWLQVDSKKAKIGSKEVNLRVPVKSYKGNIFVPLEFISQTFGMDLVWNKSMNAVFIGKQEPPIVIDESSIDSYLNLTYGGIKTKYGKASYEGYFCGGRAVVYDHLGMIFLFGDIAASDLKAKVIGIMIDGETPVWGVKNGMSISEVKHILGTPKLEEEDKSGEGYEWSLYYKFENYGIWLESDGPKEPIGRIIVDCYDQK